jgi:hypothetical protein
MKKITVIFSILFLTFTGASAQDRVQYDKAAAKKDKGNEQRVQLYVNQEIVAVYPKFDTIVKYKNGHRIETVKDKSLRAIIRLDEKGTIVKWQGDTLLLVVFATRNTGLMTVSFKPTASGPNNDNNALQLKLDQKCVMQINGSTTCEGEKYLTLQGKQFKVASGSEAQLEHEPWYKNTGKAKEIVSNGKIAK